MNKKLIKLLLLILIVSLPRVSLTNSYLEDNETSVGNTMRAGCWGEGIDCAGGSPHLTSLHFYARDDKQAVGFRLSGISPFNQIDYEVRYTRDGDGSKVEEVVTGTLDNSSADDSLTHEWIILGTCSDGGTCVYHQGIETVSIEVILHGPVDRTLSADISL
jgi:hypothetical protein